MSSSAPWAPLKVFMERDRMSEEAAQAEVARRLAIIEYAISEHGPQKIVYDPSDPDEIELEAYRKQLLELLPKAQAVAARLQKRYQNQV